MIYYYGTWDDGIIQQRLVTDLNTPIDAATPYGNETFSNWEVYVGYVQGWCPPPPEGFGVNDVPDPGEAVFIGDPLFGGIYIPPEEIGVPDSYYAQLEKYKLMANFCYFGEDYTTSADTTGVNAREVVPPDPVPQTHKMVIRDGFLVGENTIRQTGRVKFDSITGWNNAQNAQLQDDKCASHTRNADGETLKLICKRPRFTIPPNSVIKGIKVYVRRRRI